MSLVLVLQLLLAGLVGANIVVWGLVFTHPRYPKEDESFISLKKKKGVKHETSTTA